MIIVATAWIANRNASDARKREEVSGRQLRESVATISESCAMAVKRLNENCSDTGDVRAKFIQHYYPSDFSVPLDGLAALPLHQIGDAQLITAILTVRGVLGRISHRLEEAHRNLTNAHIPFDVSFLRDQTALFNAHASIWRRVYGNDRENDLRKVLS